LNKREQTQKEKQTNRKSMKYVIAFTTTVLLSLSADASAQHQIASRIRNEMGCEQREKPLVLNMGYRRDQGTLREKFVAIAESQQGDERVISFSRIDDVYLDQSLTADTISAYRIEKCLRGFDLRNYTSFSERIRERLLYCQALSRPGADPFRRCLDDLLHVLEASVEDMVEKP
jgi:hypothetical protein